MVKYLFDNNPIYQKFSVFDKCINITQENDI